MINARTPTELGNSSIHCIMTIYLHCQLLGGSSVGITHNDIVQGPIVVIAVMTKETSPPHLARSDAAVNVFH